MATDADARRSMAADICQILRIRIWWRLFVEPLDVADRFWLDYLADYGRRLDRQIMAELTGTGGDDAHRNS